MQVFHVDTNIGLKGIVFCPTDQLDDQLGFLVHPLNNTRQRYGCAHGDTLPWNSVEQLCVDLAFGIDQRDTEENPQCRILGLNLAVTIIWTPRVSNPWDSTTPWCQDIGANSTLHRIRPMHVTYMTTRTRRSLHI